MNKYFIPYLLGILITSTAYTGTHADVTIKNNTPYCAELYFRCTAQRLVSDASSLQRQYVEEPSGVSLFVPGATPDSKTATLIPGSLTFSLQSLIQGQPVTCTDNSNNILLASITLTSPVKCDYMHTHYQTCAAVDAPPGPTQNLPNVFLDPTWGKWCMVTFHVAPISNNTVYVIKTNAQGAYVLEKDNGTSTLAQPIPTKTILVRNTGSQNVNVAAYCADNITTPHTFPSIAPGAIASLQINLGCALFGGVNKPNSSTDIIYSPQNYTFLQNNAVYNINNQGVITYIAGAIK